MMVSQNSDTCFDVFVTSVLGINDTFLHFFVSFVGSFI